MAKRIAIADRSADATTNLALDTLEREKQALIFVNSRRSAEAQAERIAKSVKTSSPELLNLAERILKALSSPTKQCRRLAACIKRGVAFHHAGLAAKQRDLIEEAFRATTLRIICSTPTLAAGIDMPAYRAIIRDLKRYSGGWGMTEIGVLEYHQMAGRAGRPGMEREGEAITLAAHEGHKEHIIEHFIRGEPEEITSKLAAEPALRSAILSLIATEYVREEDELTAFFERTFYAHQYGDVRTLQAILNRMLRNLEGWGFITRSGGDGFVSADTIGRGGIGATDIGRRVSELYLDPLTAHQLLLALHRAAKQHESTFALLHLLASTLEMRPLLRVKARELEAIQEEANPYLGELYLDEPNVYEDEYEEFLNAIKTALFMREWIEEADEEHLMERYDIRPGEIHAKLERADWLCYACEELTRLLKLKTVRSHISKIRFRLKHGVREELFALLKFRNIGRVRARKLHRAGIRDTTTIKAAELSTLAHLLGPATAAELKRQVGQEVSPVPKGRRTGQTGLGKY